MNVLSGRDISYAHNLTKWGMKMYKSFTIFNELNQNNLGEWALDFNVTPLNWAEFDMGQTVNIISDKALYGAVDVIAIEGVGDSTINTGIGNVIDDGGDHVINAEGPLNAGASVIGYYDMSVGDGNDATQPGSITIGGHTAVDIHDLSSLELAGLDVLVVQNPSNGGYGAEYLAALPAIQAAVSAGLILIIHDRATGNADANTILPGGGAMTFVREEAADIEVLNDLHPFANGPGGAVTDLSLDGGNSSYHGYANIASLPVGAEVLLTTPDASHAVTFQYGFGAGRVFYSSIPIDFYLPGGGGVSGQMAAYLGNLIDYAAGLSNAGPFTPGNDVFSGTAAVDDVDALGGDDFVAGNGGDDIIRGGDGNDELQGNAGNDMLFGDAGDDRLLGGIGDDELHGGDGADHLSGSDGIDILYGGDGDDRLIGGNGDDILFGDKGNDRVIGGDGNDELHGNAGDDNLFGQNGDDRILGEAGNDVLRGGDGADHLSGGDGMDELYGEDGDDRLLGGNDDDFLSGGMGNDRLIGGDGNDDMHGNRGDDRLFGQSGDDLMFGESGNDLLRGGDGADFVSGGDDADALYGEAGDDRLLGGNGADRLDGGAGSDALIGGADADIFAFDYSAPPLAAEAVFDAHGGDTDTIFDFELGVDIIEIAGGITYADLTFTASANGQHTTISYEGNSIFVKNVTVAELDAAQFDFGDAVPTPPATMEGDNFNFTDDKTVIAVSEVLDFDPLNDANFAESRSAFFEISDKAAIYEDVELVDNTEFDFSLDYWG